jgi:hypothetical protein
MCQAAVSSSEELQLLQVTIDQEEDFADKGCMYVWRCSNYLVIVLVESR